MWKRCGSSALIWICLVAGASGQDVTGERFILTTGPCQMSSGAGSPEGSVVGSPCDEYRQTNASGIALWLKVSGSATNTGWQALGGLGLANTWTAAQVFSQTTGSVALRALVTGDSYSRFYMTVNGVMYFGSGAATQDVTLYRSGANVLATDDAFTAAGVVTGAGVVSYLATGSTAAVSAGTTGDTYHRWSVDSSGVMGFGSGSAARDVNLYRSAANVLATDDTVSVGAGAWLDYATTATDSGGLVMYVGDGAAARNGYWTLDVQDPTYQYLRVIQNKAGAGEVLEWRFGPSSLAPGVHWANDIGEDATRVRTLYAAELNVWELVARTVTASIGGEIWTSETTTLTAALGSGAGDTTITVEHNNLANGDRIVLKSITNVEWMAVASAAGGSAGAYTYTVTRDLDGTGRNAWVSGQAVVNTGTTGNGFISQYAESSGALSGAVGPATAYIVRTGTTWSDLAARAVVGNLNGTYGYSAETWGFAAGDPSNAWIKIDATNGIRIGHDATTKISLDASGNAAFTGAVTAASGTIGGWTLGATSLTDTAGAVGLSSAVTGGDDIRFWAGHATPGSAPFRVTEAGVLTATSGTIGGFTLAANLLSSGTDADYVGMSSAGTNAFWAGDSTFADAEFSVTAAGVLKATSATLTGSLYTTYIEISTANGILFDAGGNDAARGLNWDDDSYILSRTDISALVIAGGAGSQINFYGSYMKLWGGGATGDQCAYLDDGELSPGDAGVMDLGSLALPWGEIWLSGALRAQSSSATLGNASYPFDEIYVNPESTTSNDYPVVYSSANAKLYHKTDGADGTKCGSGVDEITLESGIVTAVACTSPATSPAARITALEAEVAALRALVLDLMGRAGSARQ